MGPMGESSNAVISQKGLIEGQMEGKREGSCRRLGCARHSVVRVLPRRTKHRPCRQGHQSVINYTANGDMQ
jgi:hypothetical protein